MKYPFLSIACMVLFSCSEKTAHIGSKDSNSDAHIQITAEKANSFDPFQVNVMMEGNGLKKNVVTEIYASTIDSTNLKFEWLEAGVCLMTFTQQDNTKRKIRAVLMDDGIAFKDLSEQ